MTQTNYLNLTAVRRWPKHSYNLTTGARVLERREYPRVHTRLEALVKIALTCQRDLTQIATNLSRGNQEYAPAATMMFYFGVVALNIWGIRLA